MKENYINKSKDKLEKSLMIPEKENIFKRFFKWIKGIFGKDEELYFEGNFENVTEQTEYTIPKNVKLPIRLENIDDLDKNSIEYLYSLSDNEIENLNELYNNQMDDCKGELEKLEEMLQKYRQKIKQLQQQLPEENM